MWSQKSADLILHPQHEVSNFACRRYELLNLVSISLKLHDLLRKSLFSTLPYLGTICNGGIGAWRMVAPEAAATSRMKQTADILMDFRARSHNLDQQSLKRSHACQAYPEIPRHLGRPKGGINLLVYRRLGGASPACPTPRTGKSISISISIRSCVRARRSCACA